MSEEYTFELTPDYEMFYSDSSSFGVYKFNTKSELPHLTGNPDLFDHTITYSGVLSGRMQKLYLGDTYNVVAKPVYNKKYSNWQYEPISIQAAIPKSEEQQRAFLRSILTEKQTDTLMASYPNIVEDIMDGKDNVDLSKLNGIGETTYGIIKKKIIDNYVISDILAMLQPLGVTIRTIKSLEKWEANPVLLKKQLMHNPYILTKIRGFGFKKVDTLALKINPESKCSKERLEAYIVYYLQEVGETYGHTWVTMDTLKSNVRDNVIECIDLFDKYIDDDQVKENPLLEIGEGNKIGLKRYYNVEEYVFNKVTEMKNIEPIAVTEDNIIDGLKEAEDKQGFELTKEQKEVVINSFKNNITIISGKAGCVDCDTEFFNGTEWKKISEYKDGEKVLQYNEDGTAELVYPINYIKQKSDYLWHFSTKYGLDQCLSDKHNCYWVSQKGKIYLTPFKEIKEKQERDGKGFDGRFLTAFRYSGKGIELTNDQIRLMIAVFADGSFYYETWSDETYTRARFHIKKDRKKERLIELAKKCGYEYSTSPSVADGYLDIYIRVPFRCKHFPSEWYNCTQEQLKIIADEVVHWDCNYNKKNQFSTTCKEDADFIQFVFSSIGIRATITEQDRRGKKHFTDGKEYERKTIDYVVSWTNRTLVGMCADSRPDHSKTQIQQYKTKDGYEYCFTVPSHLLVLRRNKKIFITGNCGKTASIRSILTIYSKAGYQIGCCALSAKAAMVIRESTGFPATTIHRMLGCQGANKFKYNKDNPLPFNVLFIDEGSMISADIFYLIFQAIKSQTKLIICGDNGQLPPIGYGNIFNDLLGMGEYLNCYELTKVMRQAADSGITSDANVIRSGNNPIDKPELKIVTGKLKDMTYMFRDDRDVLNKLAIKAYMGAIKTYGVDDVLIGVPRKKDCVNSTGRINEAIQELLLPDETRMITYGTRRYKLGAKVIQKVNNYEKNVFNGDVGYITDISVIMRDGQKLNTFTVEYKSGEDTKTIEYEQGEIDQIDLAYAMTIHSLQGSGYKAVIIVIDNTHFALLDNCLLYTAITRAKKKCLLLAEPYAFKKCISENKTAKRQTWFENFIPF